MKFTLLLIAICVVVFLYSLTLDTTALFDEFGFSGPNMMSKPYTLVTSIFLHSGWDHLLSNILILLFFGIAVEAELGYKKMLFIFFLGAFAGSFASLLFYEWGTVAIGASAGIFALIGTGMLVRPIDISFYPLVVPIPLALLGLLYAAYNALGFITEPTSNISYVAHFGGLFIGLIFGVLHAGWKRSMLIIAIVLAIMILIPVAWFALLANPAV